MPDLYKAKIGLLAKLLIHNLENDPEKKTVLNDLTTTDFPTIFQDIYKEKARRLVAEKTLQIGTRLGGNLSEYVKIMLCNNLSSSFTIITGINVKLDILVAEMTRVHTANLGTPDSIQLQMKGACANVIKTGVPAQAGVADMTAVSDILAAEINRVHAAALANGNTPESAKLQAMGVCANVIKNGVPDQGGVAAMTAVSDILAAEINTKYTSGEEICTPPLFIDYYYQEFDVDAALVSIGDKIKSASDTEKPIVGGASKKKSSIKKKPKKRRIIKSKKPKTKKTIKKK